MVTISARNTNVYKIYNISQPNFAILLIHYVLFRGGPLEIPGQEGGYKIFAARFFFQSHVIMSLQDFFMHLTSARIFFQDYLPFAVCLHEIFSLHEFFWGNFHTPPPEISNGPPLNSCGV
jgi:hypothetical protein